MIGNPLIVEVVKIAQAVDKDAIHECPYYNVVINNKPLSLTTLPTIFSQGEYKVTMNFTTKKDEKIFYSEYLFSIISSEKHSFG